MARTRRHQARRKSSVYCYTVACSSTYLFGYRSEPVDKRRLFGRLRHPKPLRTFLWWTHPAASGTLASPLGLWLLSGTIPSLRIDNYQAGRSPSRKDARGSRRRPSWTRADRFQPLGLLLDSG